MKCPRVCPVVRLLHISSPVSLVCWEIGPWAAPPGSCFSAQAHIKLEILQYHLSRRQGYRHQHAQLQRGGQGWTHSSSLLGTWMHTWWGYENKQGSCYKPTLAGGLGPGWKWICIYETWSLLKTFFLWIRINIKKTQNLFLALGILCGSTSPEDKLSISFEICKTRFWPWLRH